MKIALAQINPTVGDLAGNQRKIAEYIGRAKAAQAELVVFPELALCGYPPEDLLYKEHFVKDNLKALQALVKQTKGIAAIVGFVDQDRAQKIYNAAAVIVDGRLQGVIRKEDLPNYGVFDEKRYFSSGQKNTLFSLNKIKVGVSVCEDIWADNGLAVRQAKAGAKVLINISSSPYHEGKMKLRQQMLIKRARQTKALICYVNVVGGQDELVFDGGSLAVDPQGNVLARAKQFEEDLLIVGVGLFDKKYQKKAQPPAPPLEPTAEIYQALVLGTRDYVRKNGFQKIVVGLSGGIDSALVAVIARDALGKENVVGVTMPSKFSSAETQLDAKILAQNLGIQFIEVPIDEILKSYLAVLDPKFAGRSLDVTEENLQARIRGNILMAFSNKFGWLVLTTGNKSEIAVGYCTLYGDMSGGFAVIKDVPKTKVYELARLRNQQGNAPLIPESVFDRAPTAELRENQTDQDSLPPYEVLDPILKSYIEEHHSFGQVLKENVRKKSAGAAPDISKMIKDVIRMVDQSEYKRRQAPPGIKITPRAFGKDWRLPITNRYKEV